jgi:hypothetical protein
MGTEEEIEAGKGILPKHMDLIYECKRIRAYSCVCMISFPKFPWLMSLRAQVFGGGKQRFTCILNKIHG